jgi:hypothetical protein
MELEGERERGRVEIEMEGGRETGEVEEQGGGRDQTKQRTEDETRLLIHLWRRSNSCCKHIPPTLAS